MDYTNYFGFNLDETLFPVKEYGFKVTRSFWKGENRKKHHSLTRGMVDDMLNPEAAKHNMPQVDFTSMRDFCCVIADFDVLPPKYKTFTEFKIALESHNIGCVTTSVSGKVKIIFLVHNYKNICYKRTLKSLVHEYWHQFMDFSKSAMTTTYLNPRMIRDIQVWLKTAIPQEPVLKEFTEIQCENLADEYLKVSDQLAEILHDIGIHTKTFRSMTKDRVRKLAALIVTDALKLCNEGVVWNQEIFAKVLGLKSPRTAAKLLKHLEANSMITMTCNYSAGNKSRTYEACGALRTLLESHGLHLEAHEQAATKKHKINEIISQLLPPAYDANRYYLIITRRLLKAGLSTLLCAKVLTDIDQRRPKDKQRNDKYFNYLTRWTERRLRCI